MKDNQTDLVAVGETALGHPAPNFKEIESFLYRLHDAPLEGHVFENPMANKAKYIPITFLEKKLDELFFGLWQTRNFRWQVVANEIVGSLELWVFHPVARTWICREGSGAAMIQQTKGAGIGDINAKIKNTLAKDMPHLKAECLKNAAKSLGATFGRDLNRALAEDYQAFTDKLAERDEAIALLEKAQSLEDLKAIWRTNAEEWKDNEAAIDAFASSKKRILSTNGNFSPASSVQQSEVGQPDASSTKEEQITDYVEEITIDRAEQLEVLRATISGMDLLELRKFWKSNLQWLKEDQQAAGIVTAAANKFTATGETTTEE